MAKDNTPYRNLIPPLSSEEYEALAADIRKNGVLVPVVVDEDGTVLDGHHRLKCDPAAPRRVVTGMSEEEKQAFVFQTNFARRNLSPAQRKELRAKMKEIAMRLRQQDSKRWTQEAVAAAFGVAQRTVSDWLGETTPISGSANRRKPLPDARVTVPTKEHPQIAERVKGGETQAQVAADYGVTQQHVARIVEKAAKKAEKLQAALAGPKHDSRIIVADFRSQASEIADASVDLIFTDPPYDNKATKMLPDLGAFAAAKLKPGGSMLSYVGQTQLPAAIEAFGKHLRYWWIVACVHSGGTVLMREYGIRPHWKPILWYVKGRRGDITEIVSDTVSGGKEKQDHEWQQAESEARYWIERLCPADGIVCDPFLGSGTTAVAAINAKRAWAAFEVNSETAAIARKRIHDHEAI